MLSKFMPAVLLPLLFSGEVTPVPRGLPLANLSNTLQMERVNECDWSGRNVRVRTRPIWEFTVVSSQVPASSTEVIQYLDRIGWEPATCTDLMLYRQELREDQAEPLRVPMVALGQEDGIDSINPDTVAAIAPNDPAYIIHEIPGNGGQWEPGVIFLAVMRHPV